MTAESLLILLFGMLAGGCLGAITTWRFCRKLEAFGVKLWQWQRPFDMKAPMPEVVPFDRQSSR